MSDPYEQHFKHYNFEGLSPKQKAEQLRDMEEQTSKEYSKVIHPKILEAYRKHGYLLANFMPSAEMENCKKFWEMVNKAGNPVKHEITQVYRIRANKKEHFFYNETVRSKSKNDTPIEFSHMVGREKIPQFVPDFVNDATGEISGESIGGFEVLYELEFPKDFTEELQEQLVENVSLVCITPSRKYSGFTLDQFLEYSFDELVTFGRFGTISPVMVREIEKVTKSKAK